MKNIGIWIDKNKAHLVIVNDDPMDVTTIISKVKDYGTSTKRSLGGPFEVIKDRKVLEIEKQQTKLFFKDIISSLKEVKSLMIMGPAQMGQKFKKTLDQYHPQLASKVRAIKKCDKMTINQLKAMVRDFFKTGYVDK